MCKDLGKKQVILGLERGLLGIEERNFQTVLF